MTTTLAPEPALTSREAEVVALVSQGLTNKEIAGRLGVTPDTVKDHVNNVLHKKRMKNRVQIAVWHVLATPPRLNAHPEQYEQLAAILAGLDSSDRWAALESFAGYCASDVPPKVFADIMRILNDKHRKQPNAAA